MDDKELKIFRTHSIADYELLLQKKVGEANLKKKPTKEDQMAKVILGLIEGYVSYGDQEGLGDIIDVLYRYSKIVTDEKDIFRRDKLELHIPKVLGEHLVQTYIKWRKAGATGLRQRIKERAVDGFVEGKEEQRAISTQDLLKALTVGAGGPIEIEQNDDYEMGGGDGCCC